MLDLGANIGLFGVFVLERFTPAELTAVEPNPANVHLLELTASANADAAWKIVAAAAHSHQGSVPFVLSEHSLSHIPDTGAEFDVEVPAVDALPLLAWSDLAKIDVEGAEWALLADRRFETSGPPLLVLEYHPHLCPSRRPREAVQMHLERLGYDVQVVSERRDGYGVVWGRRDIDSGRRQRKTPA